MLDQKLQEEINRKLKKEGKQIITVQGANVESVESIMGEDFYSKEEMKEIKEALQSEETLPINIDTIKDKRDQIVKIVNATKSVINKESVKELIKTMTEGQKELWFPNKAFNINLERLTADGRDMVFWEDLLNKVKEGLVPVEDVADYITLSHLTVTEEPHPEAVIERQMRDGLKSRVGVRLLNKVADTVNNIIEENFAPLYEMLDIPKQDIKLLTSAEGDNALVPVTFKEEEGSSFMPVKVAEDIKEQLLREFFVGDIIYDNIYHVSFSYIYDKLTDLDDYEFESNRTIIVDAGFEYLNKTEKRMNYSMDLEGKKFVIYTLIMANIFDGTKGTIAEDRSVYKYIIDDDLTKKQVDSIYQVIRNRYLDYMKGRKEFSLKLLKGELDKK